MQCSLQSEEREGFLQKIGISHSSHVPACHQWSKWLCLSVYLIVNISGYSDSSYKTPIVLIQYVKCAGPQSVIKLVLCLFSHFFKHSRSDSNNIMLSYNLLFHTSLLSCKFYRQISLVDPYYHFSSSSTPALVK